MAERGVAAATNEGGAACALIREHHFQDVIQEVRVCGQILAMKDSYLIWVGSAQPSFANLDVAMCSSMQAMPVTSTLMGSSNEGIGSSLSQRLAMKLKAQVTVPAHLLPCAR